MYNRIQREQHQVDQKDAAIGARRVETYNPTKVGLLGSSHRFPTMPHSYEELRAAALDILSGREKAPYEPSQYEHLSLGIGQVLAQREGRVQLGNFGATYPLDAQDKETLLELFWDLFRQGIITLGLNDNNRAFPFFRPTKLGQQIAQGQAAYFFHDVSSYEAAIRKEVPDMNDVTLLYLKEAMQAFRSGCMLSATVMLGVAVEHTFMLLLEVLEGNTTHRKTFASVFTERTLLQKFNKFRNLLEPMLKTFPSEIREDLDTHFAGILSVIRTFRNQSGHPTGKIIDREQTFVLLQLAIPYCRKQYQLMKFFK